jgi:predicted  nucleic acid-binding Zn-ribbon protein
MADEQATQATELPKNPLEEQLKEAQEAYKTLREEWEKETMRMAWAQYGLRRLEAKMAEAARTIRKIHHQTGWL